VWLQTVAHRQREFREPALEVVEDPRLARPWGLAMALRSLAHVARRW
jgi:hypothetical protein